MISFILWVVFIVCLVLAVPIVHWLDQRGRASHPDPNWSEDPGYGDEGVESAPVDSADGDTFGGEVAADDGFGDAGAVEFAEAGVGDDFAAFEEEFK